MPGIQVTSWPSNRGCSPTWTTLPGAGAIVVLVVLVVLVVFGGIRVAGSLNQPVRRREVRVVQAQRSATGPGQLDGGRGVQAVELRPPVDEPQEGVYAFADREALLAVDGALLRGLRPGCGLQNVQALVLLLPVHRRFGGFLVAVRLERTDEVLARGAG
ncbi:hypothetical protein AB0O51_21280 [Streptomyces sp. NPDC090301]|uniref:hypothetical protein n=1 Tax=Streptomyces sp. NPDC090301 TaxID=3154975 RepID=UPI00343A939B